jgi:AcrR family transcriptional regulator
MSIPQRKRLTREESQAQTRERLLSAARDLFVRQGFGAASIRDIAEDAGYSQGAFYSNFETKEAVLLELLQRHMEGEAEQLSKVLALDGAPGADVLARLDRWAETLNTDADWSMLAIELQLHANRSPSFAKEYRAVLGAHQARLGALVAALFDRLGLAPPAAPDELAVAFMALAHGLAVQRIARGPDPAGKMIMVFLRALVSSAAPVKQRKSGHKRQKLRSI